MTDYFYRLVKRTLGLTPVVRPLVASQYAKNLTTVNAETEMHSPEIENEEIQETVENHTDQFERIDSSLETPIPSIDSLPSIPLKLLPKLNTASTNPLSDEHPAPPPDQESKPKPSLLPSSRHPRSPSIPLPNPDPDQEGEEFNPAVILPRERQKLLETTPTIMPRPSHQKKTIEESSDQLRREEDREALDLLSPAEGHHSGAGNRKGYRVAAAVRLPNFVFVDQPPQHNPDKSGMGRLLPLVPQSGIAESDRHAKNLVQPGALIPWKEDSRETRVETQDNAPTTGPSPTPTIQVKIGRVEVRAISTPPPSTPIRKPHSKPPILSLDEYLQKGNENKQ